MNIELPIPPETSDDEQELFEHFRYVVDKGQSLLRIDKFLTARIENTTRTRIQSAAETGSIRVNDKTVKSNYKVKPGDVVTIVLPQPPREIELIPENIPLTIVYEDDDLVIVNKPPGMVVHPAYGNYSGTLVNALLFHFQNLPVPKKRHVKSTIAQVNPGIRPGLVHRLDKNTSGIMVVAKNELAMTALANDFFHRTIDRKYCALVWGDFKEDEGTITGNVGRNLRNRKIMDVFPEGDQGKHAVTHYNVLERFGYVTLVECKLETGRTHQIRVHMKYAGHPVFNDEEYGGEKILKGTTFQKYKQFVENGFALCPRQALHARSLGFKHPVTGKKLNFDSDLPEDMKSLLEKWREYTKSSR